MNTQQKRVKWSRGETTDALEERTDTGITNVSAEFMENVVCDIYGNVSRRPALKLLDFIIDMPSIAFYASDLPCIPFFVDSDDFVIITNQWCFRVKNRKIVARAVITNHVLGSHFVISRNTSYAQQNNYMIVADDSFIYKLTLELDDNGGNEFTINLDRFKYSGGWYAPNGTKDYAVSDADITGLEFNKDKKGASPYTATNPDGSTTVYSLLDTGLTGAELSTISEKIPKGSIVYMPNLGCSFRVEGYRVAGTQLAFPNIVFDGTVDQGDVIPGTGTYAYATKTPLGNIYIGAYRDGVKIDAYQGGGGGVMVKGNKFMEVYVDSGNNYKWRDASAASKLYVYGSLLTPIVDKSLTDSNVNVTTGYVSLSPAANGEPHPAVVLFKDQRLWASRYIYGDNGAAVGTPEFVWYSYPGLVVASQIAKYTDFKNDYNYENEAITLDILTKFKEEVIYLVEYNGLKIFTDYAEYDYNGGVVKQSENGALRGCQPLVFGSLLLYADKTGHQIKAMQYELQSNIFASNIVNNLVPQELVGNPVRFAGEEEKEHYVGRFLYVLNSGENSPRVSVCDFVPDTQNIIWTRWDWGWNEIGVEGKVLSPIVDIIPIKKPIFVVRGATALDRGNVKIFLAELDYDSVLDFQASLSPSDEYYKIKTYTDGGGNTWLTLANTTVAVYDGDKFMWYDTTGAQGKLTKSLSSLTNPIVGVPINAKIRSHPIDVGGKTKSIAKRISKSLLSMRNTNAGAITVNKKTGYWNPDNSYVNFYNCTGMKREVKLEIENIHSAKFTIESVLMNIEYGTLVS